MLLPQWLVHRVRLLKSLITHASQKVAEQNTGSDLMLVTLAKDVLGIVQRPTQVQTGRLIFKL